MYHKGYIKKNTVIELLKSYKEDCHRFSVASEEFNNCIEQIERWDAIDIDKKGWICPRCKKVNAPFTPSCDCQENDYTNYVKQVDCINGYHQWECMSISTAGVTYRCRVCGKTITENHDVNKSNITISQ